MSIDVRTSDQEPGTVLSQYDTDVDYLSYWTARNYEHRAEMFMKAVQELEKEGAWHR